MRFLVLLLVLVLGAPTAIAQPRGRGTQAPVDRRETIKKKIRALRAYTLTEELKLDDKTAAQLFPALARWDDVTDKLLVQRVDLTRQLAGAGALKDPRAIDKLIDAAVANQKAFWDLEDKRLAELRRILTPAQTARLVMVLPAFERRIQNQLRKAIQNRGAGRASRRNNLDDLGDDDDFDPLTDDEPLTRGTPPAETPRPRRAPAPAPPPLQGADKACDPFSSAHCQPGRR